MVGIVLHATSVKVNSDTNSQVLKSTVAAATGYTSLKLDGADTQVMALYPYMEKEVEMKEGPGKTLFGYETNRGTYSIEFPWYNVFEDDLATWNTIETFFKSNYFYLENIDHPITVNDPLYLKDVVITEYSLTKDKPLLKLVVQMSNRKKDG